MDAVRQARDSVAGLRLSALGGALRPVFPEWWADLPPAPEPLPSFLHDRTDGLPLAVEDSVRLLRYRADLDFRDGEWARRSLAELQVPPTVRDSVLERAHRLSPDAERVLNAASVLAEPAD